MRGAVSVALIYRYFDPVGRTADPARSTLITTTLLIVLFSTMVFGALTKPLLDLIQGPEGEGCHACKLESPCWGPHRCQMHAGCGLIRREWQHAYREKVVVRPGEEGQAWSLDRALTAPVEAAAQRICAGMLTITLQYQPPGHSLRKG